MKVRQHLSAQLLGVPNVRDDTDSGQQRKLSEALQHLQSAIELLDLAEAPAHIAAHADLAVHQLLSVINHEGECERPNQIDRNAEPQ